MIPEIDSGGGNKGGEVIFTGTPIEMIDAKQSITAQYLKKIGSELSPWAYFL